MKFSIIHASYGRPGLAGETLTKWMANQSYTNIIEYILSVDIKDPDYKYYREYFNPEVVCVNHTNTSVAAINHAAQISTGDILIVISDDFDPIKNWDTEILKVINRQGFEHPDRFAWILKTRDGIQPWIITLPIMNRKFYEMLGHVYHPDYDHMFCDTELSCIADLTKCKISSNLLFKHNHYSVVGGKDQTSEKADLTWNTGMNVFKKRLKNKFDLPDHLVVGEIEDRSMIDYIKNL